MIYTFLADVSRLNIEAALLKCHAEQQNPYRDDFQKGIKKIPRGKIAFSEIGEEIRAYIISANNTALRRERFGAYILLYTVIKEMLGIVPPIIRTKNGKPYFCDGLGVEFNVSHSEGVVAVSISEDRCVGVDVECEIVPERAQRIEKRFFGEIDINSGKADVTYIYCDIDELGDCEFYKFISANGLLYVDVPSQNIVLYNSLLSDSFSSRWTIFEAALKCEGGGFSSLPRLSEILFNTYADTKRFCINGKIYYVSTVTNKKAHK